MSITGSYWECLPVSQLGAVTPLGGGAWLAEVGHYEWAFESYSLNPAFLSAMKKKKAYISRSTAMNRSLL